MKEIKLTKGYTTLVDDEDYDYLDQFSWCVVKTKPTAYNSTLGYMHRLIMKTPFKTAKEAAVAYNEAVIKYFGEFASLNKFVEEEVE